MIISVRNLLFLLQEAVPLLVLVASMILDQMPVLELRLTTPVRWIKLTFLGEKWSMLVLFSNSCFKDAQGLPHDIRLLTALNYDFWDYSEEWIISKIV